MLLLLYIPLTDKLIVCCSCHRFRGTPNVSEDDYKAVYEEMGGYFNAATSGDYTYYYTTFPATSASGDGNLDQVLFVESDRFKNINYTEAAFKTEGT